MNLLDYIKIEEIKNQARKEFVEELKRMSLEDIIKKRCNYE